MLKIKIFLLKNIKRLIFNELSDEKQKKQRKQYIVYRQLIENQ